jgi:hypothetical protein
MGVNAVDSCQMRVSPADEPERAWFGRCAIYGTLPLDVAMCGAWHPMTRHYT